MCRAMPCSQRCRRGRRMRRGWLRTKDWWWRVGGSGVCGGQRRSWKVGRFQCGALATGRMGQQQCPSHQNWQLRRRRGGGVEGGIGERSALDDLIDKHNNGGKWELGVWLSQFMTNLPFLNGDGTQLSSHIDSFRFSFCLDLNNLFWKTKF